MTSLLLQMLFVCVCEGVTNFHDTVFLPVQWSLQTNFHDTVCLSVQWSMRLSKLISGYSSTKASAAALAAASLLRRRSTMSLWSAA